MPSSSAKDKAGKLTPEQKRICHVLHKAHIRTLLLASQSYDKAILNLSTVTLGFSFAFIEAVRQFRQLNHTYLLCVTWGLLIWAIFFILVSFLADQKHSANEIQRYQGDHAEDLPCVKCVMTICPPIAGGCFFFAIFIFTVFVWLNLSWIK